MLPPTKIRSTISKKKLLPSEGNDVLLSPSTSNQGDSSVQPMSVGVGGFKFESEELSYLSKVLDSNQLSYGPLTKEFERRVAKAHSCDFGIFMNSGTSALHVGLAAMKIFYGWNDGDEVIIPSTTFVATANIVLHNNLVPVFVDVDPITFNISPERIESNITDKTKCIIPVHLLGLPCEMDQIVTIANKYKLRILEDSCETMFSNHNGKPVGSFGDVACFSTYVAHFLVTGTGGMAITRNPDLAILMRSLMNHGRDSIYLSSNDDDNLNYESLQKVVQARFRFEYLGHSFRSTEMEAALGLGQLDKLDWILESRYNNAKFYTTALANLNNELRLPDIPTQGEHSFMLFPVVVRNDKKKDLIAFLESRGIETRDLLPLVNQPVYKSLGFDLSQRKYPNSWYLVDHAFYIGCHPYLSKQQLDYVVDSIQLFFFQNSTR